jgi:MSHA pilin protein MshC
MRRMRGFTLVEMVAVILIAAILATFAAGALDTKAFDTVSFAEEVRSQVSYAQKLAVAARRPVTVEVDDNAISITRCLDFACSGEDNVQSIRGNASLEPKDGSGIVLSTSAPGNSFTFDAAGNVNATTTITLTGDVTRTITIESATGYVHMH